MLAAIACHLTDDLYILALLARYFELQESKPVLDVNDENRNFYKDFKTHLM